MLLRPGGIRFSPLIATAAATAFIALIALSSMRSAAHAQTQTPPDTPTRFDVISIRTIDPTVLSVRRPGAPPLAGMANVFFLRAGGSLRAPAISARNLIAAAFGVKSWQVVDGADWITSARFAIDAKTATEQSRDVLVAQAPALIRALLTDRFQLRAHMEHRPFRVFALLVARQDQRMGPQLRRTNVNCDAQNATRPSGIPPRPSQTQRPTCSVTQWPGGMIAGGISMGTLANALTNALGSEQVVIDRTNLAGRYDVDLAWSSEPLRPSPPDAAPGGTPPNADPTLFTASREQLGLNVVLRSEEMDAVVVDHIERPSPN